MDAATTHAHAHQQHSRRWIILAFLGLAQLMVVLDATIVNVALPSIQASLASRTSTASGSSRRTRSRSAACSSSVAA